MTNSAPVNLDAITPLEQAVFRSRIPGTTKFSGWDVTFAGPSHPKTVALNNDNSRKILDESARMQQARANGKKFKVDAMETEEARREFVEDIVARILSWTPVSFDGKTYEFDQNSTAPAVELLLQRKLGGYVAQFYDYLADEKAFMPASATN